MGQETCSLVYAICSIISAAFVDLCIVFHSALALENEELYNFLYLILDRATRESVVAIKFNVCDVYLYCVGKANSFKLWSKLFGSSNSDITISSSYCKYSGSSSISSLLNENIRNAFPKFEALSVTVPAILSTDNPNY